MSPEDKRHRKPKVKSINPIEEAIKSWYTALPEELTTSISLSLEALLVKSPRRWTAYPPLILLPSGSFESDLNTTLMALPSEQKIKLWELILSLVSKREGKGTFTHLAINAGIPLSKSETNSHDEQENILRTPSGLIMLHGDFGPALSPQINPTAQDFNDALWVSTKQNGITQIWAPRYTMFSRGNIKEKARILDFHSAGQFPSRKLAVKEVQKFAAVDLYAGIGYFVFSYVKMGMGKVIGWELNPWSVEGLKRGAHANGWNMKIIKNGEDIERMDEAIIIFQEDNRFMMERFHSQLRILLGMQVLHVNCGLLPTSSPVWEGALNLVDHVGWLHLHENVGVNDVANRMLKIKELFCQLESQRGRGSREVDIEHVELVKTFAPGVWHCVFDLLVGSFQNSA